MKKQIIEQCERIRFRSEIFSTLDRFVKSWINSETEESRKTIDLQAQTYLRRHAPIESRSKYLKYYINKRGN